MSHNIILGVVFLNYNSSSFLDKALEGITRQSYTNYHIVIVDNGSSRDEQTKLLNQYDKINKIDVVINEKNLGFARGNNVGINYLREKYGCNSFFIVNTDTFISDNNFFEKCIEKMKEDNIGVISPMCLNKDGSFQIPYGVSDGNLIKEIIQSFIWICWTVFRTVFHINLSISKDLRHIDALRKAKEAKYIVQGPAYFLTPSFFSNYKQLFPMTFLYGEERWLILYLKKAKLRTEFIPEALVYHYEGGSTSAEFKSISLKRMRYMLHSLFVGVPLLFMTKEKICSKYSS